MSDRRVPQLLVLASVARGKTLDVTFVEYARLSAFVDRMSRLKPTRRVKVRGRYIHVLSRVLVPHPLVPLVIEGAHINVTDYP